MMKKYLLLVLFALLFFVREGFAQTNSHAQPQKTQVGQPVVVRVADVMNGLAYDYYEAERLADDPYKYRDQLLDRIQLMRGDLATIKRLNQNKKLDKMLKDLKNHIDRLEVFTKKNDNDQIHKTLGQMYVTCFQCHTTHRDHSDLE